MPLSPDAQIFSELIVNLSKSDTEHISSLCKLYEPGEIPVEEYLPDHLSSVVKKVNQLDSKKYLMFSLYLEGVISATEKENYRKLLVSQSILIVGGQSNINNHVTTQNNRSNLSLNFEPSVLAYAIENNLISDEHLKQLLDIIGTGIENRSQSKPDDYSVDHN